MLLSQWHQRSIYGDSLLVPTCFFGSECCTSNNEHRHGQSKKIDHTTADQTVDGPKAKSFCRTSARQLKCKHYMTMGFRDTGRKFKSMDEYLYRDTDSLAKRNDTSSVNTPTTHQSVDSPQNEPAQHDFDFFNLNQPSTQADRRAARRNQENRGLAGLPKQWRSAGTLSSSTTANRRDRYSFLNDDSRLLSSNLRRTSMTPSNGFSSYSTPQQSPKRGLSPKRAHSPQNSTGRLSLSNHNRRGLSPKSASVARMKLVPSSLKSSTVHSANSPESRRNQVSQSITDALANLPLAPTMPMGQPLTPGVYTRKSLLKSDAYQRMSNSMTNLRVDSSHHRNTPLASHFKNKTGMGGHDVFDLDPFDDSHSLGVVDGFSTGDEDDDFFSGNKSGESATTKSLGSKSRNSASATSVKKTKTSSFAWDDFVAKNRIPRSKSYDSLESDVQEMKRSLHEQEKDMEREIQKRDEIIRRLTEQLEMTKGSQDSSKADKDNRATDITESQMIKSKPKDKPRSKRDNIKSKKGSKKERQREADASLKRRPSTGVLEGSKKEKIKRRGSSGLVDGRKLLRKERKEKEKEEKSVQKKALDDMLGDDHAPSYERSDSHGSTGKAKRRGSGASARSLKSANSVRSRKSTSDAKKDSRDKKKKAKKSKSKSPKV